MKLTKYVHACIVLEEQGSKLIIDPGSFTTDFGSVDTVAAVVVTHVHGDHFNADHLRAILAANPNAMLFTTREVAQAFEHANLQVVAPGENVVAGPFSLRFLGTEHAQIHPSIPLNQNTAVLVNEQFFYPGDSFTLPDKPVTVLAVAENAPWANVAQIIDYIAAVKARQVVPTHNALLSESGHMVYQSSLKHGCELGNSQLVYLQPGESLDF